ncbi:MAG: glycosyltransferase family 2 protein [Beijerinckiaceae bacterium]
MPLISVVIPLYNKADSVVRTLAGALAQSFQDIEVIVVDDGSTDGSGNLLRQFQDPRLIIFHQDNAGVSAARNRAIMAARADWVAFLDADDDWDKDHLALLWRALGTQDVVAAFSNTRLESRPERPLVSGDVSAQIIEDYFTFALANGGYPNMTSAMLVRREVAIKAGLFTVGVSLGEDIDLWGRLALQGAMLYTGAVTMTYNDVPRDNNVAKNLSRRPEFPFFAGCLPTLCAEGEVPDHLEASARQFANFLLLEYARQLLDRGLHAEARQVLRKHCDPSLDPLRYGRRYARTWKLGRMAFQLSGRSIQAG